MPLCEYSTWARKDKRPFDSVWRQLDLGIWRLEIHCRRRRLWCPQHGARTEGVPFARPGSEFTRDFECLVAWLMTRTDKSTVKRLVRIDWDTIGRIVKRVCDDELDPDRLNDLFDIGRHPGQAQISDRETRPPRCRSSGSTGAGYRGRRRGPLGSSPGPCQMKRPLPAVSMFPRAEVVIEGPVRDPFAHVYAAGVRGAEVDPQPHPGVDYIVTQ